jgi:hypothetical protein
LEAYIVIYEAVCMTCGKYHTYIRKAADYLDTPICECGTKTEKRLLTAPMMRVDIAPWDAYESPATGKLITSYAERREDMKASGCRDYEGKEAELRHIARQQQYDEEKQDTELDKTVRTAWAQLSPEKKAMALKES